MKRSFEYESKQIEFSVEFRKRKTLGIEIKPPGIIKVAAPMGISEELIMAIVNGKSNWIVKKLSEIQGLSSGFEQPSVYRDGVELMVFGKHLKISVIEDELFDIPKVEIRDDKVEVLAHTTQEQVVHNAVEKWLNQLTKEAIDQRITKYQVYFKPSPSKVIIKDQKRRWGSCNTKGELRFNRKCIMASEEAIDYLVVHEMSHLIHMDHSRHFWNQVEQILPNYKSLRKELRAIRID